MIRIAIVDDHATVRQSLEAYLGSCPDLQVVAHGHNGAQAAAIAVEHRPDVLLMDLAMPGQNGLDALAVIRARAPEVAVLILSGYPQDLFAPGLLAQGAAGFLNKNCEPEDIVQAIRAVAARRSRHTALAGAALPGPAATHPAGAAASPPARTSRAAP